MLEHEADGVVAVGEGVDGLGRVGGVGAVDVESGLFGVVGLELKGGGAGIEAADAGHGIVGVGGVEGGGAAVARVVDEGSLGEGQEELAVAVSAETKAWEVDPFDLDVVVVGLEVDVPVKVRVAEGDADGGLGSGDLRAVAELDALFVVVGADADAAEIGAGEADGASDEVTELADEESGGVMFGCGEFDAVAGERGDLAAVIEGEGKCGHDVVNG